ncbi:MAG: hypothetical protein IT448_01905 [Phycisphaerales bacterium]|nr:hypothetical protein [Phycisphaerales bacterium]
MTVWRTLIPLPFVLALAGLIFFTGIGWGLPSRQIDPYLFASQPVPSGQQLLNLTGGWGVSSNGADVDRDPLAHRDQPIVLNTTPTQQAAIALRYRLYSAQPDEMITFRALAQMNPAAGDFDPHLYQYGGLWIYPVGALLQVAGKLGWVHLTSDLSYYLDHPEDFARFYLVARIYSALWGLLGVIVVYALAQRLAGLGATSADSVAPPTRSARGQSAPLAIATAAALLYILLPVSVNLAHEAKPHLAGAVLGLLAILLAARYLDQPGRWRAILTGAAVGAAGGMVLTGLVAVLVLPVMLWRVDRHATSRWRDLLLALVVSSAVFFATNPYLILGLLRPGTAVSSNFANHFTFYNLHHWSGSLIDAAGFTADAITWPILTAGLIATTLFIARSIQRKRNETTVLIDDDQRRGRNCAWLLMISAAGVFLPFVLFAKDRPTEFARFAALGHIALLLAAIGLIAQLRQPATRALVWVALIGWVGISGLGYLKAFQDDAQQRGSRQMGAEILQILHASGYRTLYVQAEPAPYCLPPVDLSSWQIILLPAATPMTNLPAGSIGIRAVDKPDGTIAALGSLKRAVIGAALWPAPMSWASKPFELFIAAPVGRTK